MTLKLTVSRSRPPVPYGANLFSLFLVSVQATSSEYSEESDLESLGAPGVSVGPGASRLKKKRDSQASYTSDMMESESDFRDLETNMDIIDEYYYGVRIFPGQDPSQVYHGYDSLPPVVMDKT